MSRDDGDGGMEARSSDDLCCSGSLSSSDPLLTPNKMMACSSRHLPHISSAMLKNLAVAFESMSVMEEGDDWYKQQRVRQGRKGGTQV